MNKLISCCVFAALMSVQAGFLDSLVQVGESALGTTLNAVTSSVSVVSVPANGTVSSENVISPSQGQTDSGSQTHNALSSSGAVETERWVAEDEIAAKRKAAEEKVAAKRKAAEEKSDAERKVAEEKAAAERKAVEEKAETERKAAEEKAAFEKLNQFLNGEFKERCVNLLQNIDPNDQKDADSDILSRNRWRVLRFAEKYGLSDETGNLNLNSNVLKKVADYVYIDGNIRSWYTDENAKYGFVREDGTVPSWGLSPEETVKEWEVSKWIDLARKWISNAESDYDRIEQIMRKNREAYAKEAKAAAERKAAEEKAAAERKEAEERAAAERKAAEEKAAAERKEAEERAAAERKAAEEKLVAERAAFEKLLPAKIAEYEKKFHFRMRTRVPDIEKRLKTFVVIKYQKQGLNDKQIAEGLRELDLQLARMPTGADVDQQRMALRSLCNMFHPLADDDK